MGSGTASRFRINAGGVSDDCGCVGEGDTCRPNFNDNVGLFRPPVLLVPLKLPVPLPLVPLPLVPIVGCSVGCNGEFPLDDFFNLGDDCALVGGRGGSGGGIGMGDSRSNANALGDWPKLMRVLFVAVVFGGDLVCGGDRARAGDLARAGDRGRMAGEKVVDLANGLKGELGMF